MENGEWTCSLRPTPATTSSSQAEFEKAYLGYEAKAASGELSCSRRCRPSRCGARCSHARLRPGIPWLTFKDACNIRSPQQHVDCGAQSNLCTKSRSTPARPRSRLQPGLGQPARAHLQDGRIGRQAEAHGVGNDAHARQRHRHQLLRGRQARNSNLKHPAGGHGHHGLPGLPCTSCAFPSHPRSNSPTRSMERCATTLLGFRRLAAERGRYTLVQGFIVGSRRSPARHASPAARSAAAIWTSTDTRPWTGMLRAQVRQHGMRNSNCVAIAPTATISNIIGVSAPHRTDVPEPVRQVQPVG